jgi:hypothetical protein
VPRPSSGPSAPNTTAGLHHRTPEEPQTTKAPVWLAVWCSSVGTTWTLELHKPHQDGSTLGPLVDWISSGLPTSQPEPNEAIARALLAEHGLHLYSDTHAGPCTHSRRSIGYASADHEVIAQAHRLRATAAETHPVLLAARRTPPGPPAHSLSVMG